MELNLPISQALKMLPKGKLNKIFRKKIRKPNGISLYILYHSANSIICNRDWDYLSRHYTLNTNFLIRYKDKLNWSNVCKCQKLSEKDIDLFSTHLDWKEVIKHQELTDNIISKEAIPRWWFYISRWGKLKTEHLIKFKDNINWPVYLARSNSYIGKKVLKHCSDKIPNNYKERSKYFK